jgi:2-polyprenyl-3-methyl-5-hydroxy-6-metoxy-1,4-benzoquinol methylase
MKKSVAKVYDEIAGEYTRQYAYGENMSLPALKKFLALLSAQAKILDVGCGGGQDAKFLAGNGATVLGIDFSREMIKLAKEYAPAATFRVADLLKLDNRIKYDGIWCCRVFHHVPLAKQDQFLNKVNSLLKKGGVLYLTAVTSDNKKDYEAFDSGNGNLLKKRLTAKSFKNLLAKHNFTVLKFAYWTGKKSMEVFTKKS